jgi:hypothetical protein
VKVEGDVPYAQVVAAMDVAQGAGASRIGLLEDQASGEGGIGDRSAHLPQALDEVAEPRGPTAAGPVR